MVLKQYKDVVAQFTDAECAREANGIRRGLRDKSLGLTPEARLQLHESAVLVRERQLVIARQNRDQCSIELQKAQLDAENARAKDDT